MGWVKCDECKGSGEDEGDPKMPCPFCKGLGEIQYRRRVKKMETARPVRIATRLPEIGPKSRNPEAVLFTRYRTIEKGPSVYDDEYDGGDDSDPDDDDNYSPEDD